MYFCTTVQGQNVTIHSEDSFRNSQIVEFLKKLKTHNVLTSQADRILFREYKRLDFILRHPEKIAEYITLLRILENQEIASELAEEFVSHEFMRLGTLLMIARTDIASILRMIQKPLPAPKQRRGVLRSLLSMFVLNPRTAS